MLLGPLDWSSQRHDVPRRNRAMLLETAWAPLTI